MAKSNDERILELRKDIEAKKKELALCDSRFTPQTNCVIELDGIKYNLNVLSVNDLMILACKLEMYIMAQNKLVSSGYKNFDSNVEFSGYSIGLWLSDINNKIDWYSYKAKKSMLDQKEKALTKLLSEDKKTELEIDAIADILKGID